MPLGWRRPSAELCHFTDPFDCLFRSYSKNKITIKLYYCHFVGNYLIIYAVRTQMDTERVTMPCGYHGISHYSDVIMSPMASQITSLTIVYSTVYSGAGQRKHQSSASLAFVRGIHREPVNSPHKGPVTWKRFPFDDVIMDGILHKSNDSFTLNAISTKWLHYDSGGSACLSVCLSVCLSEGNLKGKRLPTCYTI